MHSTTIFLKVVSIMTSKFSTIEKCPLMIPWQQKGSLRVSRCFCQLLRKVGCNTFDDCVSSFPSQAYGRKRGMFVYAVGMICKMYSPAFLHPTQLVTFRCRLRILSVVLLTIQTTDYRKF